MDINRAFLNQLRRAIMRKQPRETIVTTSGGHEIYSIIDMRYTVPMT
jgi:hypothetical protein